MATHQKLQPSDAPAWIVCPGKVRMCSQLPEDSGSAAADLGTDVHEACAHCLENDIDGASVVGQTYGGTTMTEKNAEDIQVYLDTVHAIATYNDVLDGNATIEIEKSSMVDWIHPDLGGTRDCSIMRYDTKTLHVLDYKNGRNAVDAEANPQLMIYGLGALGDLPEEVCETVELVIVQPNGDDHEQVKRWSLSASALRDWGQTVLKPACERTDDPDAPLVPSDRACKWCRAKSLCPALKAHVVAVAQTEFMNPVLPPVETLTGPQLEQVMDSLDLLVAWSKEAKAYAQQMVETGLLTLPNYKLVKARSQRRWTPEAEGVLSGILGDSAYTRKLVGIGAAEKALKVRDIDPGSVMPGITEKPDNGLQLAAKTDKRKEIVTAGMGTEFLDCADVFA